MNKPGSYGYFQQKMKEVSISQPSKKMSEELSESGGELPPPVFVPPPPEEAVRLEPYPDEDPTIFPPVPIVNPEGSLNPMSPSEPIVSYRSTDSHYKGLLAVGAVALALIIFMK